VNEFEERANGRLGTVLRGKYRIDRVLGVGGMAVVYVATHRNQKQFAVKMLHPELSMRQEIRQRFLREGYAANSVKHPGAVAVLDDDTAEDGAAFLVMELLEGEEVEAMWEKRQGHLPAVQVLGIAFQLLDVLAAAHSRGIVHRDIKPANLFVTHEGQLKVLDFGIARVRDLAAGGAHATGTGVMLGTPAFMSPEQALAKASEIDALTDIWAVGATMFSLFTGRTVHEGETVPQMIVKVATVPAPSLGSVAPHAPAPLVAVVDRALAFDKRARWQTAAEMRDAVRDAHLAVDGRVVSRASVLPAGGASESPRAHTLQAEALASFRATPPAVAATVEATGAGVPGRSPAGTLRASGVPDAVATSGPLHPPSAQGAFSGTPGTERFPQVGGTTAQPISSTQPSVAGLPKRGGAFVGAVIGIGLVGALAIGAVTLRRGPHAEGASDLAGGQSATGPAVVAASVPIPPPVVAPPEVPAMPSAAALSPDSARTKVTSSVPPALGTPPPSPSLRATTTNKPDTAASPPESVKAKPNCNPNFTLDPEGNRIFKPECFRERDP
jgi:eukaryotic-like serine/threonine-protein kinase